MMKIPGLKKIYKKEGNMIKDVRNLFILKNETDDTVIKNMRNLFKLKKENE